LGAQARAQSRVKAPRIVLDTNVLVSTLVFASPSVAWLRGAWLGGGVIPLVSRDTTTELVRVLVYPKFRLSPDDREELLGDYLPWCEVVAVPGRVRIPECPDPADLPFLKLAKVGKAEALVTGDKAWLALTGEFEIPILTPAAFRARVHI
jgi:putative PIN family toxin of toxin-antitoxin system